MNIKISIIVLVYRVEKYLKQCIESIINQTYKNLEIILVDDGSDDLCGEICDEYAEEDSRIKVVHKKNGGIDSARKAGIQVATGTYVGYVDGDDWIEPTMYERLIKIAIENDVEIVESGVIDSYGDVFEYREPYFEEGCYKGDKFDEIAPYVIYSGKFFYFGIQTYLVTKLFRRDKFIQFQMMKDYSENITDDPMVTFPAILSLRSIYITHECFYHYRVRKDSAKHSIRLDIPEKLMAVYRNDLVRFAGSKKEDNVSGQLSYLYLYLLLAKAIYVFDDDEQDLYLKPFGHLNKKDRIVLYGAGVVGINLMNYIRRVNGNVVFWADRNYKNLDEDLRVGSPKDILTIEFDYLVIAILSEKAVNSAKQQLEKAGVPREKIVWIKSEYISHPKELLEGAQYKGEPIFRQWDSRAGR